jgi:hypothetical protein
MFNEYIEHIEKAIDIFRHSDISLSEEAYFQYKQLEFFID